jgi:methylmalonyl-CoA mutase C-terminal domain/subunit
MSNKPSKPPLRILIAKPGLDGHERGALVVARALRDAGMEVVYTGLRQTPEQIVEAALQEDVDAIGVSVLSGAHNHLIGRIIELLEQQGMKEVPVFAGGIIPDQDIAHLKQLGVVEVFPPGSSTEKITDCLRRHLSLSHT